MTVTDANMCCHAYLFSCRFAIFCPVLKYLSAFNLFLFHFLNTPIVLCVFAEAIARIFAQMLAHISQKMATRYLRNQCEWTPIFH